MRPTALFACLLIGSFGCQEYNLGTKPDVEVPLEDTDVVMEPPVEEILYPDIVVEPLTLDFGYWPKNCVTETQDVTITNLGEATLVVEDLKLVGSGKDSFLTEDMVTGSLEPGDSYTFQVMFAPQAWLTYDEVRVQVTSNDPDEARVDVDLAGIGAEDAVTEETFEQPDPEAVDVLWVIDNSGSMSGEVGELSNQFQIFIDSFVNLGIDDYHVAVVTTDMNNPAQSGKIQPSMVGGPPAIITPLTVDPAGTFAAVTDLGSGGSASEIGLDAAYTALNEPLLSGHNAGFLRDDANLAIVVVSDEDNDSSGQTDKTTFVNWLNNLKPDPSMSSFSGIAGPDAGPLSIGCQTFFSGISASPAPEYADVINATGGIHADICTMEFSEFLQFISFVAAGLSTEFELTDEPTNIGFIDVFVDGEEVPFNGIDGWTWNPATNTLIFHGDSVPGPGAVIEISYPVETECQ